MPPETVPKRSLFKRRKKLIDPAYQLRYSLNLVLIATTESILLSGILVFMILNILEISPEDHMRLFYYILSISVTLILIFGVVNSVWGIYLSHRISGPIFRINKVVRTVGTGDFSPIIQLREKDELQELKNNLNEMLEGLRNLARDQHQTLDRVIASLKGAAGGQKVEWETLLTELQRLKDKTIV